MGNLHNRLKLQLCRKNEIFYSARKAMLKYLEWQSLVPWWRNIVKYVKYSPVNFPSFVCICITSEKSYRFWTGIAAFSLRNTNVYKISKLRKTIFSVFTSFRHQTLHFY